MMSEVLNTPKSLILPNLDDVDPEIKKIFEQYNNILEEFVIATYSDISWLHKRAEVKTWTPALKFGGNNVGMTYSSQGGYYTKIGNLVTMTGRIVLTAKGTSTGSAVINGLPFTVKDNTNATANASLFPSKITFANVFVGYAYKNTTTILLQEVTEAGVVTNLSNANFADDSVLGFSVSYFTD